MQRFRDAEGVRWSVRRVWWPFGEITWDPNDSGFFFWLGFLFTAPLLIAWPFWLVARFLGAAWTIKVRRKGKVVRSEKVAGFGASRRRIVEIADELRAAARSETGEPESGAIVY
ncbi:hypothetical protein BH09ACT7_BH09ACT7_15360 [soil metagenome]